jgi:hypothetical protein
MRRAAQVGGLASSSLIASNTAAFAMPSASGDLGRRRRAGPLDPGVEERCELLGALHLPGVANCSDPRGRRPTRAVHDLADTLPRQPELLADFLQRRPSARIAAISASRAPDPRALRAARGFLRRGRRCGSLARKAPPPHCPVAAAISLNV